MPRIRWKRLRTAAEVREAVLAQLPIGSDLAAVRGFAAQQGLEFSDPIDGIVRAAAPAKGRRPFVSAKWLLEFRIADGRFAEISVKLGLTGP